MTDTGPARPTALVTGASSGIGREFARLFASERYDVVLVARNEERLSTLAKELEGMHGVSALALAADLTDPTVPGQIYGQLAGEGVRVDVLVNNAGFGGYGKFHEADLEHDLNMVQVNVCALVHLSKMFVRDMVERGSGNILNVASTAGFFPGPFQPVYYATKAFVISLSEAMYDELRGTGVNVTVLCPGMTQSEFHERAGTKRSKIAQARMATAESVARAGYEGMRAGKRMVVPKLMNKVFMVVPRLIPRGAVAPLVRSFQRAAGSDD